jgi:carboxyl-terminal processing protease
VINKKDDLIEVVSPIDDTPAYRAGLKAGDMIIKIGDKAVRGMSLEDGVSLMRGTPTTSVDLTIARKGEKPFKVNIVRDIITITSARGYLLDKDLGYLRISSFQEPTTNLVIKSIDKLIKQNNGKLKSLIIDLRNNPGGLLTSAIQISDAFLDNKELVVYTKGKLKSQFSEFFAKPGDITGGANIVVLINEGSASASEILAGALQDNKRALVIGKKSFGKGSVQTIVELDDGYGLKITTARYYTPSGRSIQAKGIEPDVSLKNFELKIKDEDDLSITEANLDNHIDSSNDKEQAPSFNEDEEISTEEQKIKDLKQDYFVHEAINLLKALDFIKNGK